MRLTASCTVAQREEFLGGTSIQFPHTDKRAGGGGPDFIGALLHGDQAAEFLLDRQGRREFATAGFALKNFRGEGL